MEKGAGGSICVGEGADGWGQGGVVGIHHDLACYRCRYDLADSPPLLADTPSGLECVCVTAGHTHGTGVSMC